MAFSVEIPILSRIIWMAPKMKSFFMNKRKP